MLLWKLFPEKTSVFLLVWFGSKYRFNMNIGSSSGPSIRNYIEEIHLGHCLTLSDRTLVASATCARQLHTQHCWGRMGSVGEWEWGGLNAFPRLLCLTSNAEAYKLNDIKTVTVASKTRVEES